MLSHKSSVDLKIVGIEGHSADTLRDAVDRGARFVIYSYNFSLVVMSFKRPSNIYFIRPGQSSIVRGLPFTLISLVFGWWGFPWGIIYTFRSLYQNLGGGTDVTESVLASLAPRSAPEAIGAAAGSLSSSPGRPRAQRGSARRLATVVGVVVALVATVYSSICFFEGQNLRVALVSGLPAPYTIELNGTSYKLSPRHPELVTLAEGDFVLRGAPGTKGEQHFVARTDFFSRPFDRHVLVVNPDRAALVYLETVNYHPDDSTPDPNEKGSFTPFANRVSYFLAEPDYFFEPFPTHISMPADTSVVVKSRLAVFDDLPLETRVSLLRKKLGDDAVRAYLVNLARFQADDDAFLQLVLSELKPGDARALLESHLADRPVLVELHRTYQGFMQASFPDVDLLSIYRKSMEAAPDDGACTYLYARLLTDPAESNPLFRRALQAKHPCAYGAYALSFDAFAEARYTESLDLLRQAERAGLHNEALQTHKREILLALGRTDDVLAEIRQRRAQDKTNVDLFADELMLTQSQAPDRVAGEHAIATFETALRARFGANDSIQSVENFLGGQLAYALGEEREAAGFTAKLKGTLYAFETAVDRRDPAAARSALAGVNPPPSHFLWLLMLTAHAAGDDAAADQYFHQAVAALAKSDRESRVIAAHIEAGTAADHAALLHTLASGDELRVMFIALGLHFPAQRAAYFARARELDRDPAFPHLLLQSLLKEPAPSAKL